MNRPLGFAVGMAALAVSAAGCTSPEPISQESVAETGAAESMLPAPVFHHIHINSVDPERSLEWYSTYWPQGTVTTYAGFPAIYDDISVFANRTIDRPAPPGSATIWFLSRVVGFAHAQEILLESHSLSSSEALELKIVNAVVPSDGLEQFALEKAEHFASKSRVGLSSLVVAMNNSYGSLPEYLERVGTGFESIYSDE